MRPQRLTILARVRAKEDKRDFVLEELQKLVAPTRAEEGCINYVLHQDIENDNQFFFVEHWEDHDLWQKHMDNDLLAAFKTATEGSLEEFVIHQLHEL